MKNLSFSETLDKSYSDNLLFIVGTLNNLARVYGILHEYPKSLEYHRRAIEYSENLNKPSIKATLHLNYGARLENIGTYNNLKAYYDSALHQYLISLEIRKKNNLSLIGIARCYNNIGIIYKEKNNLDSALVYLNNALKIKLDKKREYLLGTSFVNIANVYSLMGNYEKAFEYNRKAQVLAVKDESLELLISCYESIGETFRMSNQYDSSFFYIAKYIEAKDSLLNESKQKAITELETKYETEKKEADIARLEQQNLTQQLQQRNTIFLALAIGGILLAGLVFFIYRNRLVRKEKETQDAVLELQNDRIEEIEEQLANAKHQQDKLIILQEELKQYNEELQASSEQLRNWREQLNIDKIPERENPDLERFKNLPDYDQVMAIVNTAGVLTDRVAEQIQAQKENISRLEIEKVKFGEPISKANFEKKFEEAYPKLMEEVIHHFPDITPREKELFMLIRLGASKSEAREAMNEISLDAMTKLRQRLSKRFDLSSARELDNWVKTLK